MAKDLMKQEGKSVMEFGAVETELMDMMSKDAAEYVDETSTDDMTIPRISILQSGSGEVKKADPKRIEGAEEGDFFNSVNKQIFKGDEGIYFVPVKRRVVYVEWKDRNAGGGLVRNYGENATLYNSLPEDEFYRRKPKADTEIVKTYEVFGYQVDIQAKRYSQVVIAFAKTQVKKMKNWNTLIRTQSDKNGNQLPEYACVYKLTTTPESNDHGSWFNYKIGIAGYTLAIPEIGKNLYTKSKEFAESIKTNAIDINYEESANSSQKSENLM